MNPILTIARIITFGMAVSVFLFPMVVAGAKQRPGTIAAPPDGPVIALAVIAGFALLVFAGAAQRFLIRYLRERGPLTRQEPILLLALIVAMSMREVCAIIGLQLSLSTGKLLWCVLLGVPAFVAILANWPAGLPKSPETGATDR